MFKVGVTPVIIFFSLLFVTANCSQRGDLFGCSLSASQNLVAVGALGTQDNRGAVYLFNCTSSTNCVQGQTLTATNGHTNDTFGASVALFQELLIVGAPGWQNNAGTLFVYNCSSAQNCQFIANRGPPHNRGLQDFGYAVFISNYWVVASAPRKHHFTGAAYLMNCFNAQSCSITSTLQPNDLQRGDLFGISVGMFGRLVAVGANNQNGGYGAVYLFNCSDPTSCIQIAKLTPPPNGGSTTPYFFGASLWVDSSNKIFVGAPGWQNSAGAVYTYQCLQNSQSCSSVRALIRPRDGQPGDLFGTRVVANNGNAVVGAPGRLNGQGGAYTFSYARRRCQQIALLTASHGKPGDFFGYSLAISNTTVYIGVPERHHGKGGAYAYDIPQSSNYRSTANAFVLSSSPTSDPSEPSNPASAAVVLSASSTSEPAEPSTSEATTSNPADPTTEYYGDPYYGPGGYSPPIYYPPAPYYPPTYYPPAPYYQPPYSYTPAPYYPPTYYPPAPYYPPYEPPYYPPYYPPYEPPYVPPYYPPYEPPYVPPYYPPYVPPYEPPYSAPYEPYDPPYYEYK